MCHRGREINIITRPKCVNTVKCVFNIWTVHEKLYGKRTGLGMWVKRKLKLLSTYAYKQKKKLLQYLCAHHRFRCSLTKKKTMPFVDITYTCLWPTNQWPVCQTFMKFSVGVHLSEKFWSKQEFRGNWHSEKLALCKNVNEMLHTFLYFYPFG